MEIDKVMRARRHEDADVKTEPTASVEEVDLDSEDEENLGGAARKKR